MEFNLVCSDALHIFITILIEVCFDKLLGSIRCCILRHFLYLVRDRALLMERGVYFLFTSNCIASFTVAILCV